MPRRHTAYVLLHLRLHGAVADGRAALMDTQPPLPGCTCDAIIRYHRAPPLARISTPAQSTTRYRNSSLRLQQADARGHEERRVRKRNAEAPGGGEEWREQKHTRHHPPFADEWS